MPTGFGVKMIKHQPGADPAAVIYDAVQYAKAIKIDFVLSDTAGRMHTNLEPYVTDGKDLQSKHSRSYNFCR